MGAGVGGRGGSKYRTLTFCCIVTDDLGLTICTKINIYLNTDIK